MKILKKETVASIPLGVEAIEKLYVESQTSPLDETKLDNNRSFLKDLINIFEQVCEDTNEQYQCFIEKRAFDAFVAYADEAYKTKGHEATGIIFGYFFHSKNNPENKIAVATNFIQANGPATSVTCTISYDDVIRYNRFCEENKMLQVVWIHSHPTYGTFYSGTDSAMLMSSFYAPHQMGVVVDNVRNQAMGFKIVNGQEKHENVHVFDLEKSLRRNKLVSRCLFQKESYSKVDDSFENEKQEQHQRIISLDDDILNKKKGGEELTEIKKKSPRKNVKKRRDEVKHIKFNTSCIRRISFKFRHFLRDLRRPLSTREIILIVAVLGLLILLIFPYISNLLCQK